jgi:predicted nucleic acid-binding protein
MILITPRKSQEYRKLITDLYVSAKTKLLAKEDSLDLDNEFKEFTKWRKKSRVSNSDMDLDKAIELELKERVSEDNANKLYK